MIKDLMKVTMMFLAGYLFIAWTPSVLTNPSDMIAQLVIEPFQFFAASIAFISGLLLNASLTQKSILLVLKIFRRKINIEFIIVPLHILSFYILSLFGFWKTIIYFGLGIIYGMISGDFRTRKRRAT
ncbi:hypothetical protein JOC86_000916 [Bacillus pakistanensis]|uniref:Uncharacterized protein n=1 Tax=Rossellomorea pakistanensis TaxID=992288 RepID=A0ABS2N981_9BACI|nr:hypothetical protein [Bacillus pakistanensis]MBM7584379.1 hypothetical protein [Bacillus pakistanensis]